MAYDATQPTSTTKIRNLSSVIPDNFSAIETGDSSFLPQAINLANRTPLVVSNDPTAIANSNVLYSKDDDNGDPQVFSIDPSSVISQLTPMIADTSQIGSLTIGPLIINWGRVTATIAGTTATFAKTFPNAHHAVTATANETGVSSVGNVTVSSFTNSSVKIHCSSSPAVTVFYIAIGY